MSFPPLPQFTDTYDGRKLRFLVESLENSFRTFNLTQQQASLAPIPFSQIVPTGNVGSTETTLFTQVLPAQGIIGIGWQIYIRAFGTFASNGNAKELKLYLNNTVIYDSTGVTVNGGSWDINAMIVDTGQNSQSNIITSVMNNASPSAMTAYSSSSENIYIPSVITLSGTGNADNDITAQAMITIIQPISAQ